MTLPANIAQALGIVGEIVKAQLVDALQTSVTIDRAVTPATVVLARSVCSAHDVVLAERDAARTQLAAVTAQRDALVKATGGFVDAFDEHGAFDGLFWGSDSWMTAMRDALQAARRPTASAQPEQPKPAGGAL